MKTWPAMKYAFIWVVLGRPVRFGEPMNLPASAKMRKQVMDEYHGARKTRKVTPNMRKQMKR